MFVHTLLLIGLCTATPQQPACRLNNGKACYDAGQAATSRVPGRGLMQVSSRETAPLVANDTDATCAQRCADFKRVKLLEVSPTVSCEKFCLDISGCDCQVPWDERCKLGSCAACAECSPTPSPTAGPTVPPVRGVCTSAGDPHIKPFDVPGTRHTVNILGPMGDYWIVKNPDVYIQSRYGVNEQINEKWAANAHNKALGIGGSFLQGNKLIIESLAGGITYNGQPILAALGSTYSVPNLFEASYKEEAKGIKKKVSAKTVSIAFPTIGMTIKVTRWTGNVNFLIDMLQLPGGQDGHCGNFNGDKLDDSEANIKARMMTEVDAADLIFPALAKPAGYTFTETTLEDCDLSLRQRATTRCTEFLKDTQQEAMDNCVFDSCFLNEQEAAEQLAVADEDLADAFDAVCPAGTCACTKKVGSICQDPKVGGDTTPRNPSFCTTKTNACGCAKPNGWLPAHLCTFTPR